MIEKKMHKDTGESSYPIGYPFSITISTIVSLHSSAVERWLAK